MTIVAAEYVDVELLERSAIAILKNMLKLQIFTIMCGIILTSESAVFR